MNKEESDKYIEDVKEFIRTCGSTDPIQIVASAFLRNWNPNVFFEGN